MGANIVNICVVLVVKDEDERVGDQDLTGVGPS